MIAVVGSPSFQPALRGRTAAESDVPPSDAQPRGPSAPIPEGRAAGLAAGIAATAVAAGASVQIVGKIGDDPAGEAVVRWLARAGVGHAALSRTSADTPVREPADDLPDVDEAEPVTALLAEEAASDRDLTAADTTARGAAARTAATRARTALDAGQPLDAADVALGLGYLRDIGVIVAVGLDDEAVARVVAEAGAFSAGPVVAIVPAGVPIPPAFAAATVLEAPDEDPDAAFASFVGRFAAALDRGVVEPAAFRAAADEGGWSAAE